MNTSPLGYDFLKVPKDLLSPLRGNDLTPRETDVLACIMAGRSIKATANLLAITPKTVEVHTYNLMRKLECNARDHLINLVEKEGRRTPFLNHYTFLSLENLFQDALKKIQSKNPAPKTICWITEKPSTTESFCIKALKSLGIRIKKSLTPSACDLVVGSIDGPLAKSWATLKTPSLLFDTDAKKILECPHFPKKPGHTSYGLVFFILKHLKVGSDLDKIMDQFQETQRSMLTSVEPLLVKKPNKKKERKSRFTPLILALLLTLGGLSIYGLRSKESRKIIANLSLPDHQFLLKRSDLLKRLHTIIQATKKLSPQNPLVAVAGVGGCGKTTLTHLYALKHKKSLVWEINGESKEKLMASLDELASYLCQSHKEKRARLQNIRTISQEKVRHDLLFQMVQENLKEFPGWILIYDNVETLYDIRDYLPRDPKKSGAGTLLLTTRDANISVGLGEENVLKIDPLNQQQTLALFKKIYGDHANLSPSDLENLPPFPLDISVAAHYIRLEKISLKEYLDRLKNSEESLKSLQTNILKNTGKYLKTRSDIIMLSVDKILKEHPEFKEFLLLVALIDPQNIPRDLLDQSKAGNLVDNFIYHLESHSLINHVDRESDPTLISFHRSIQKFTLVYLFKYLNLQRDKPLMKAIARDLERYIKKSLQERDTRKMKILVNHARALISRATFLAPEDQAPIYLQLGNMYKILGQYDQAEACLTHALSLYKKAKKPNLVAKTLGYMGGLYSYRGRYDQAIEVLHKSLKQVKSLEDKATMTVYLGNAYKNAKRFPPAETYLRKGLELYRKLKSPLRTVWVQTYLGSLYTYMGQHQRAKHLLEEGLRICDTHKNIMIRSLVLGHFGLLDIKMGHPKNAVQKLETALKIYKENFKKNHIGQAWLSGILGLAYKKMGDKKKAKKLLQKNYSIYQDHYTPENMRKYDLLWYLEEEG